MWDFIQVRYLIRNFNFPLGSVCPLFGLSVPYLDSVVYVSETLKCVHPRVGLTLKHSLTFSAVSQTHKQQYDWEARERGRSLFGLRLVGHNNMYGCCLLPSLIEKAGGFNSIILKPFNCAAIVHNPEMLSDLCPCLSRHIIVLTVS